MVLNTNGMPFTLLFLNLFSLDKTTFPIFLSIRFSGYPRDINQGFVLTLHYLKSFSLEHSRPTYLQCWTVNNGSFGMFWMRWRIMQILMPRFLDFMRRSVDNFPLEKGTPKSIKELFFLPDSQVNFRLGVNLLKSSITV